ncbi:MAG: DUF2161 family putative PD-(D/E)XK-type phosphodiesterase [Bacilli bacterium]|jgi:hypothetical protein|nr:DUF2161 family putative PD-(D/E)XK-type phosphodiesterase [Bacilli bacterium]
MLEKEMFFPLKTYLEKQGFTVQAEIEHADIVAMKNDEILIVEMKTAFSTKLIVQGIKRQSFSDYTYLAIPKPNKKNLSSLAFQEKKTIVKHLGLGLLLVDTSEVLPVLDAVPFQVRSNKRRKRHLQNEFLLRKTASNEGGVNKTKIVTAYRELACLLADYLKEGPKTTKDMKTHFQETKVLSILQHNFYGWFERVSKGVYQLSGKGIQALLDYQHVIQIIHEGENHNEKEHT